MPSTVEAILFLNQFISTLQYNDESDGSFGRTVGLEARIASTALSYAGYVYDAVQTGQVPVTQLGQRLAELGLAASLTVSAVDVVLAGETYGTSSPEYAQALGAFAIQFGLAVALLSVGVPITSVGVVLGIFGLVLPNFPGISEPVGDAINLGSEWILDHLINPLLQLIHDPLILDLDGDGIEVTPLDGSEVYFDYDGDGFAERTGWVSADDGLLVIDDNGNGMVDGAAELFGSPTQDGFAVLETLDSNGDGRIDVQDAAFGKLRVWRDLNQNGVSDAGELQTLPEAGITSISLTRTDLPGSNQGHTVGFGGSFTWSDGALGSVATIYFQVDHQDTQDNTPPFTPADGVDLLPLLPGSGTIHSLAYKATQDADFRAAWTALTDQAAGLDPSQLRAQFETLLLQWAGVDGVNPQSRGEFVDARHLAFVEAFFGEGYRGSAYVRLAA